MNKKNLGGFCSNGERIKLEVTQKKRGGGVSIAIEIRDKKPKNPQLVCSNREREKKKKH